MERPQTVLCLLLQVIPPLSLVYRRKGSGVAAMLIHSLAGDGRPNEATFLLLPRLADALNTSAAISGSGLGGAVCSSECPALASFSLCLWVNLLLKMPASVVMSYFISSYVHNALIISKWKNHRLRYLLYAPACLISFSKL